MPVMGAECPWSFLAVLPVAASTTRTSGPAAKSVAASDVTATRLMGRLSVTAARTGCDGLDRDHSSTVPLPSEHVKRRVGPSGLAEGAQATPRMAVVGTGGPEEAPFAAFPPPLPRRARTSAVAVSQITTIPASEPMATSEDAADDEGAPAAAAGNQVGADE
jgi:hypothetical protein